MSKKDDFLSEIKAAEDKAKEILDKARKDGELLLVKTQKAVESEFSAKIEKQKDQIKAGLVDAQKSARSSFESVMAESQKKAEAFKKEQQSRLEKGIAQAQSFFITELL